MNLTRRTGATAIATAAALAVAGIAAPGIATAAPSPDVVGTIAMSGTAGTLAPVTGTARGTGLGDTDDNAVDLTVGEPTPIGTPTTIHEIQGDTRVSPRAGELVVAPGVVTAVRAFGSTRGFWFQEPRPDADPATSEGLFAFTGSTPPPVQVGDAVTVTGTVTEFRPGSADSGNQSTTQLTGPVVAVASSGNPVPFAEVLTDRTIPENYTPVANGGSIDGDVLQPATFALDFFESREGMRIGVADVGVVGATDGFNGLFVTTEPRQNDTARGGTLFGSYTSQNSGRVKIESLIPFAQQPFPKANVGDRLTGITDGPLDYTGFGGYVLQATTLGPLATGPITREVTAAAAPDQLTVGTYNVENLDPTDPQAKFDTLAGGIVTNMKAPDVVGLEEIQDNSGAAKDGVVASNETLTRFVDAIVAAGGPRYDFRVIDPENDQDGGEPGGNIRVAFLFNPARVGFVDRPGGDAVTAVQAVPAGRGAALSVSPGRVDPTNPAWDRSRKPLVGEFVFQGKTVFVVTNHFASKGGDQPLHGRFQPPNRVSEIQRTQQATVLRGFLDQLSATDSKAAYVVLGDLNDYPFSATLNILTRDNGPRALIDTLRRPERYSYVFEGNSQTLDHILTSRTISNSRVEYDVVRINAEFTEQASDHDPQVARIRLR